jgi:hypothetical protein
MINWVLFNLLITNHAKNKKLAVSQCLLHLVSMCPSKDPTWLITWEGEGEGEILD